MKVKLEEAGELGNVRCPYDRKNLLVFQVDDVLLENCDHYKWYLTGDKQYISDDDNEKDNNEEDNDDEEDWDEIVRSNHIAAIEVQNGIFYLIPVKKADEKD